MGTPHQVFIRHTTFVFVSMGFINLKSVILLSTVMAVSKSQQMARNERDISESGIGTNTLADKKQARSTYQQQVIVNPFECGTESGCNCTTTREIVSSGQADLANRLEQLQLAVSDHRAEVSSSFNDVKHQLQELQQTVADLAALITHSPDGTFPADCTEVLARGDRTSGEYTIQPQDNGGQIQVFCDMDTEGGGWTVFQRRQDGSVDFYRDWESYRLGFGNLSGEFWLGNDNLHRLTALGDHELRVDVTDTQGTSSYIAHDSFDVANQTDMYRLTLGTYTGTTGDVLTYHNNQRFSTKGRDNDESGTICYSYAHGCWWYKNCFTANLNGGYYETKREQQITLLHGNSVYSRLENVEMKFRTKK